MNNLGEIQESTMSVVCHDAGAANLIVHWLKKYQGTILPCMVGPAIKIWNYHFPEVEILRLDSAISNSKILLSGTGNNSFEHDARIKAKDKGMYNISVIDHWTRYKQRFVFNGKEVLPDLILVSDHFARRLAKDTFPLIKVKELSNQYLESEKKSVFRLKRNPVAIPPKNILIVTENFKVNSSDGQSLDFESLNYFIGNLDKINKEQDFVVRIRPHPSESYKKYKEFKQKEINIQISKNLSLHQDLAWADMVVGIQSFAMVVSQHCNIPTMSMLPPDSIKCVLPYREILFLRDL